MERSSLEENISLSDYLLTAIQKNKTLLSLSYRLHILFLLISAWGIGGLILLNGFEIKGWVKLPFIQAFLEDRDVFSHCLFPAVTIILIPFLFDFILVITGIFLPMERKSGTSHDNTEEAFIHFKDNLTKILEEIANYRPLYHKFCFSTLSKIFIIGFFLLCMGGLITGHDSPSVGHLLIILLISISVSFLLYLVGVLFALIWGKTILSIPFGKSINDINEAVSNLLFVDYPDYLERFRLKTMTPEQRQQYFDNKKKAEKQRKAEEELEELRKKYGTPGRCDETREQLLEQKEFEALRREYGTPGRRDETKEQLLKRKKRAEKLRKEAVAKQIEIDAEIARERRAAAIWATTNFSISTDTTSSNSLSYEEFNRINDEIDDTLRAIHEDWGKDI